MKNSMIKKLAEKAKNRLLRKGISDNNDRVCVRVISDEDLEFASRAREVFIKSENQNLCNPIKMLIDEKVLMQLDERGRERYLLQTVDKYLKAKKLWLNNQEV